MGQCTSSLEAQQKEKDSSPSSIDHHPTSSRSSSKESQVLPASSVVPILSSTRERANEGEQQEEEEDLISSSSSYAAENDEGMILHEFTALSSPSSSSSLPSLSSSSSASLVSLIRSSVIGSRTTICTPFGSKEIIYADYTASGRQLTFIEAFMSTVVAASYANTHTDISATGAQTSYFREEARAIIADAGS
jgi:hypothetical protein